jgi:hypothetical protein
LRQSVLLLQFAFLQDLGPSEPLHKITHFTLLTKLGIPPDAMNSACAYAVREVEKMKDFYSTTIQTIVIGGGQAGLAVGYHLAKRGLPFLILDANKQVGTRGEAGGTRFAFLIRRAMQDFQAYVFQLQETHSQPRMKWRITSASMSRDFICQCKTE